MRVREARTLRCSGIMSHECKKNSESLVVFNKVSFHDLLVVGPGLVNERIIATCMNGGCVSFVTFTKGI